MSGSSARSIRNFSFELLPDLVLPNVGQADFHDFRKYWNFNVLEMALKTFRFVQGLPRTPLLFSSIFQNHIFQIYLWALVSEPGFLDFQIFRFVILEICLLQNIFEKYVGERSRNK